MLEIGVKYLKATGVTRRIDELGRIVIPKEIRRNLGIRDGETLEIYTNEEGIFLQKHSVLHNMAEIGTKLCEIISSVLDIEILLTDREKIIASTYHKELIGQNIPLEFMKLVDNRESLKSDYATTYKIDNTELTGYFSIVPIIASIDSLGLVVIIAKNNTNMQDIAKLVSKIMAEKLDI